MLAIVGKRIITNRNKTHQTKVSRMSKWKCVDNNRGKISLTIDKVYETIRESATHITITNDRGIQDYYRKERFYLVDEPVAASGIRKFKAIESYISFLTKDKVYYTDTVTSTTIAIVDDLGNLDYYYTTRFVEVFETQVSSSSIKATFVVDTGNEDINFFSSVRTGYCKCNVPRESCFYHRD